MAKPFVHRSTVRFNHTDPASYVFFPRYFEMIQATVEDWFYHALGIHYADFVTKDKIGLPTARIECEFLHPCRLGEELEIAVYLERFGRSSIQLLFVGSVAGEVRLRARSVLVTIEMADGRPQATPEDWRAQFTAYQKRQGDIPQWAGGLRPKA